MKSFFFSSKLEATITESMGVGASSANKPSHADTGS